jgi:hypothetical protein
MCGSPIDWNGNGSTAEVLSTNLNEYGKELSECGGLKTLLADHDDWGNIVIPITDPTIGGGGVGDDGAVLMGTDCPAQQP